MSQEIKGKWAILIGINFYAKGTSRPGLEFTSLKGCVADVLLVESVLRSCFGVCESNLFQLTATAPVIEPLDEPLEPPYKRPTYQNIIDTFLHVTDQACSGDAVYIHYSGHGARAKTIFAELKQPKGQPDVDEVLVPYDINTPSGHYLRDVEIAALLKEMLDKKLVVTMVIDACHSAGATRGSPSTLIRGLSEIDLNVLESDRSLLPQSQLANAWSSGTPGISRRAKKIRSWLIEPRGYTLLAACRSHEEAAEYQFDGKWHGVFTYWLIDSLNLGWQAYTYEMIHHRVSAKVNARFKRQTPILSGEGDRMFFESTRIRPLHSTIVVSDAHSVQMGGALTLGSGLAHGICLGNQFAIYHPNKFDPNDPTLRLAIVRVTDVQPTSCTAVILELSPAKALQIGIGDNAVLTTVNSPTQQRTVRLLNRSHTSQTLDQDNPLWKLREYLNHSTSGFTTLVGDDYLGSTHFQVVINDLGQYEIWDTNHQVIENLYPGIVTTDEDAVDRMAERLTHLTKYHNVWELDNPDRSCQIYTALVVRLVGWRPVNSRKLNSFDTAEGLYEVEDGDVVILEVENSARNGSAFNITILDLQPGWSIQQIHPRARGANYDTVEAGKSIRLEFQMKVSKSTLVNHIDILKIFATDEPTSFRWLELAALNGGHRALTYRSPAPSTLEEILASFNTNRLAIPLTRGGWGNWATSSISIRTRA